MEWYEELDYEENPFKDNEDTELIGYEDLVNEILYGLESGNIVCVEGKSGAGKTAILKAALNKFHGSGKVVYLNGQQLDNGLNVEKVLKKKEGFVKSLFNKKPKNMILLLDEVQNLSQKNCERIKYYFDNNFIKSAIFTSSDFKKVNFTESLKERISKTLRLRELTEDEAVDIVQSRLGSDEIIPEEVIKEVFSKSERNMKRFLTNCDGLCTFAFQNNGKKVLPEHLKEFFNEEEEEPEIEDSETEDLEVEEPSKEVDKKITSKKAKNTSPKTKSNSKKVSTSKNSIKKDEKKEKLEVEEPVTVAISDDFRPAKKEVKMEDEIKEEEIDIDAELKKLKKANEVEEEDELGAEDYEEDYDDFKEFEDEEDEELKKMVDDESAEKYY